MQTEPNSYMCISTSRRDFFAFTGALLAAYCQDRTRRHVSRIDILITTDTAGYRSFLQENEGCHINLSLVPRRRRNLLRHQKLHKIVTVFFGSHTVQWIEGLLGDARVRCSWRFSEYR